MGSWKSGCSKGRLYEFHSVNQIQMGTRGEWVKKLVNFADIKSGSSLMALTRSRPK